MLRPAEAPRVALDVSRSPEVGSGRLPAAPDERSSRSPGLPKRVVAGVEAPLWVVLVALLSAMATIVSGTRTAGGPILPVRGAAVAAESPRASSSARVVETFSPTPTTT